MLGENEDLNNLNGLYVDPVEHYFECISSCDIADGKCISKCVEILREHNN